MSIDSALTREIVAVDDARPMPRNIDGREGRLRGCRANAPDARTRSSAGRPAKLHNGQEKDR